MIKRIVVQLTVCLAVACAWGESASPEGEPTTVDAVVTGGWARVMSRYYLPKTGCVYSCEPQYASPASFFENGFRIWRQDGDYGVGLEDCAILGGVALSMLCDRYAVTGETSLAEDARRLAEGLVNLTTVHGVTGFVARGICPEDGKSVCALSSIDQHTHCVHGLWRYWRSPISRGQDATRARAAAAVRAVAERMRVYITEENDWSFPQAVGNGTTRGICKMWKNRPHEAARLPMVYLAAARMTGEAKYGAWADELTDEALARSLALATTPQDEIDRWMPNYTLLQMVSSLEVLAEEAHTSRQRERAVAAMRLAAELAVTRSASNGTSSGCWLCSCGEIAAAQVMTPGFDFTSAQRQLLVKSILAEPFARANAVRIVMLSAAWWRARFRGCFTKGEEDAMTTQAGIGSGLLSTLIVVGVSLAVQGGTCIVSGDMTRTCADEKYNILEAFASYSAPLVAPKMAEFESRSWCQKHGAPFKRFFATPPSGLYVIVR